MRARVCRNHANSRSYPDADGRPRHKPEIRLSAEVSTESATLPATEHNADIDRLGAPFVRQMTIGKS